MYLSMSHTVNKNYVYRLDLQLRNPPTAKASENKVTEPASRAIDLSVHHITNRYPQYRLDLQL